jgi:uncharacterized protein
MKSLILIYALTLMSPAALGQSAQSTPGGQTVLAGRPVRDCDTPLIKAIHARDLQQAQAIAASNARLDEQVCSEGETALIESIATGMNQVSANLIAAGANVNLADRRGVTPLMYAAWHCQEDILSFLLNQRANVNAVDADGSSALMFAAYQCENAYVLAKLLKAKADVNAKSKEGETALTLAAASGAECAVRMLLIAGADPNLKTKDGQTAIAIARDKQTGRRPAHDRIYTFLSYYAR